MPCRCLRYAVIDNLFLDGSSLPGLQAERLEARGGVSLKGADVSGRGAPVRQPARWQSQPRWSVDLMCRACRAGRRMASRCDRWNCAARRIAGETRMTSARVDGDLDLTGARLSHPDGEALHLNRTVVRGGLFLRGGAEIKGALDLTGASIDTLHDDEASWPAPGNLLLNRCLYNALIGGPMDARRRLAWLARQSPDRWGEDFWPQPYEQLAHVFREMGHDDDARTVLVEKERLQRAARRARTSNPLWRLLLPRQGQPARRDAGLWAQAAAVLCLAAAASGVWAWRSSPSRRHTPPSSRTVPSSCGRPNGRCAACRGARSGCLPPFQRPVAPRRGNPSSTASLLSPRRRAIPHSMPGCTLSTRCFPVLEIGQKEYWRPDPAKRLGLVHHGLFLFPGRRGMGTEPAGDRRVLGTGEIALERTPICLRLRLPAQNHPSPNWQFWGGAQQGAGVMRTPPVYYSAGGVAAGAFI